MGKAESLEKNKGIEEFEKNREWWWVAENKRSKRMDYFITIFITDHAQLVGYVGSLPHTLQWFPEGASIVNEEVYNEQGIIPEPEEESLKVMAEINDYRGGKTSLDKVAKLLDPEDAVKFGFRWHPKVKDEVMRECFECIRQGLGYPSMRNDPILISNAMNWHGHPLEEARTWVHQACMSSCPTTKHGFQPFRMASATANTSKMVEYALFNGYDLVVDMQMGPQTGDVRNFSSFEQLFEAWVKQMEWLMDILVRSVNLGRVKDPEFFGRPFLSAISQRSVESGIDAVSPEGERGNAWITFFTWVENADSLAAVKKLVFDEKKYTMAELIDALKNNWEGKEADGKSNEKITSFMMIIKLTLKNKLPIYGRLQI
jgi:pyruvate-formate lyase